MNIERRALHVFAALLLASAAAAAYIAGDAVDSATGGETFITGDGATGTSGTTSAATTIEVAPGENRPLAGKLATEFMASADAKSLIVTLRNTTTNYYIGPGIKIPVTTQLANQVRFEDVSLADKSGYPILEFQPRGSILGPMEEQTFRFRISRYNADDATPLELTTTALEAYGDFDDAGFLWRNEFTVVADLDNDGTREPVTNAAVSIEGVSYGKTNSSGKLIALVDLRKFRTTPIAIISYRHYGAKTRVGLADDGTPAPSQTVELQAFSEFIEPVAHHTQFAALASGLIPQVDAVNFSLVDDAGNEVPVSAVEGARLVGDVERFSIDLKGQIKLNGDGTLRLEGINSLRPLLTQSSGFLDGGNRSRFTIEGTTADGTRFEARDVLWFDGAISSRQISVKVNGKRTKEGFVTKPGEGTIVFRSKLDGRIQYRFPVPELNQYQQFPPLPLDSYSVSWIRNGGVEVVSTFSLLRNSSNVEINDVGDYEMGNYEGVQPMLPVREVTTSVDGDTAPSEGQVEYDHSLLSYDPSQPWPCQTGSEGEDEFGTYCIVDYFRVNAELQLLFPDAISGSGSGGTVADKWVWFRRMMRIPKHTSVLKIWSYTTTDDHWLSWCSTPTNCGPVNDQQRVELRETEIRQYAFGLRRKVVGKLLYLDGSTLKEIDANGGWKTWSYGSSYAETGRTSSIYEIEPDHKFDRALELIGWGINDKWASTSGSGQSHFRVNVVADFPVGVEFHKYNDFDTRNDLSWISFPNTDDPYRDYEGGWGWKWDNWTNSEHRVAELTLYHKGRTSPDGLTLDVSYRLPTGTYPETRILLSNEDLTNLPYCFPDSFGDFKVCRVGGPEALGTTRVQVRLTKAARSLYTYTPIRSTQWENKGEFTYVVKGTFDGKPYAANATSEFKPLFVAPGGIPRYPWRSFATADYVSKGGYNFLAQWKHLLVPIGDMTTEHGRRKGHNAHATGVDFDMNHFYGFPDYPEAHHGAPGAGTFGYGILANAALDVAEYVERTGDSTLANAPANVLHSRTVVNDWITVSRTGLRNLANLSEVNYLMYGSGLGLDRTQECPDLSDRISAPHQRSHHGLPPWNLYLPVGWMRTLLETGSLPAWKAQIGACIWEWKETSFPAGQWTDASTKNKMRYNNVHWHHIHIGLSQKNIGDFDRDGVGMNAKSPPTYIPPKN